jgi:hypothetical protein
MRAPTANPLLKVIGALAILAGLGVVVLVLARAIPGAVPDFGWGPTLIVAVPMTVFGGYIIYLGYSLLRRASRAAFSKLWFGAFIFGIVFVTHRLSSFPAYAIAAVLGLLGALLQPFVTTRLFHDDPNV